jgi:hypothetical protein
MTTYRIERRRESEATRYWVQAAGAGRDHWSMSPSVATLYTEEQRISHPSVPFGGCWVRLDGADGHDCININNTPTGKDCAACASESMDADASEGGADSYVAVVSTLARVLRNMNQHYSTVLRMFHAADHPERELEHCSILACYEGKSLQSFARDALARYDKFVEAVERDESGNTSEGGAVSDPKQANARFTAEEIARAIEIVLRGDADGYVNRRAFTNAVTRQLTGDGQ